MKDYLGGTWIFLEGHTEKEGKYLVAIGYTYNKKTVLSVQKEQDQLRQVIHMKEYSLISLVIYVFVMSCDQVYYLCSSSIATWLISIIKTPVKVDARKEMSHT